MGNPKDDNAPVMVQYAPLPVWARHDKMQDLSGVPDNFLRDFAVKNPDAVRKFGGGSRNGTLIYNVSAVLSAIDQMREVSL